MNGPLVSVVIPAFDAGKFLGEAIESVLAERSGGLEVVVVDDGSSDDTARVAAQFTSVTLVRQPHAGVAAARNSGVARASGEVLAFLDADDLWPRGRLAPMLAALEAAPDALVFGHVVEQTMAGIDPAWAARLVPRPGRYPGYLPGALLTGRRTAERLGPFDPTLAVGELVVWLQRARSLGVPERLVEEVVLVRRLHGGNLTLQPGRDAGYLAMARALLRAKRGSKEGA